MKMKALRTLIVPGVLLAACSSALAIAYDQNVNDPGPGVFYGSGNANGSWTVDTAGGLELGLRAHVRYPTPLNVFNSGGDGSYAFTDATGTGPANRASWNYDFSINTLASGHSLAAFSYWIGVDIDPTANDNFYYFNAFSIPDNALFGLQYAQNSENPGFPFVGIPGYNKDAAATYDFTLAAFSGDRLVAETGIRVNVNGGVRANAPDSASTLLLLGMVVPGLEFCRRKFRR